MKTKFYFLLTVALATISLSFCSCQKQGPGVIEQFEMSTKVINFIPAKTSSELIALRANPANNLIRTLADFEKVVAKKQTPLAQLTSGQLEEFRKSFVIRDSVGVVSLNYSLVKEVLSYDDFAIVMGLFGMDIKQGFWGLSNDPKIIAKLKPLSNKKSTDYEQELEDEEDSGFDPTGPDYKDYTGYWCLYRKTCQKQSGYICTTGC